MINIKKGLDLPLSGQPKQTVSDSPEVSHVALLAADYPGLRPSMAVEAGDTVKKGQLLFQDKKNPGSCFTAPAGGTVAAVNRGDRRAFQSIVIKIDPKAGSVAFKRTPADALLQLPAEDVIARLVESGMWTAFRTRPFDKVPAIGTLPHSIFVTAMDTNPLAPNAKQIIDGEARSFVDGLHVISRIAEVPVFVCKGEESLPTAQASNIREEVFIGKHPAGLPGTHIHFLDPVSETKTVWHIGYQDVIAIGHLFVEGEFYSRRVISIGGPLATNPRLVETQLGASVAELTAREVGPSSFGARIVSGSVLWGHTASGPFAYMGRYQHQISILEEGTENELMGWLLPGAHRHSVTSAYLSSFIKPSSYKINTALNGGVRPILPIGIYAKVMPLDVEPIMLLRAIEINDVDQAKLLGALEMAEEDVAACTYVCPGKTDFGQLLRRCLTKIELEG